MQFKLQYYFQNETMLQDMKPPERQICLCVGVEFLYSNSLKVNSQNTDITQTDVRSASFKRYSCKNGQIEVNYECDERGYET